MIFNDRNNNMTIPHLIKSLVTGFFLFFLFLLVLGTVANVAGWVLGVML